MSCHPPIFPTTQCWTHTRRQPPTTSIAHVNGREHRAAATMSILRESILTSTLCICSKLCNAATIKSTLLSFPGLQNTQRHAFIYFSQALKSSVCRRHRRMLRTNRAAYTWMLRMHLHNPSRNIQTGNRKFLGHHGASRTEVDVLCGNLEIQKTTQCLRRYTNSRKTGRNQVVELESAATMHVQ